jgi:hypothetical protein
MHVDAEYRIEGLVLYAACNASSWLLLSPALRELQVEDRTHYGVHPRLPTDLGQDLRNPKVSM